MFAAVKYHQMQTCQRWGRGSVSVGPGGGGQMKEVEMDGYKILLIREKGELRALSALCTHYGAPLIKGAYDGGGSIRCPWHGACFNTKTGGLS